MIIPNHIYIIISHENAHQIPNVIRDFKRHTSKQVTDFLRRQGEFSRLFWWKVFLDKESGQTRIWQKGYHPSG